MRLERRRRRAGTIGLTPLIDIVFILLLFFMLSTQFDDYRAMPLRVPAEAGAVVHDEDPSLSLVLLEGGDVRIDGDDTVSPESLAAHPLVREALASGRAVRLHGETAASLQSLVSLMDRLSAIGFTGVALGRPG